MSHKRCPGMNTKGGGYQDANMQTHFASRMCKRAAKHWMNLPQVGLMYRQGNQAMSEDWIQACGQFAIKMHACILCMLSKCMHIFIGCICPYTIAKQCNRIINNIVGESSLHSIITSLNGDVDGAPQRNHKIRGTLPMRHLELYPVTQLRSISDELLRSAL